jgi:hypothetical protein
MGWVNKVVRVKVSVMSRIFTPLVVQTSSGEQPASYPKGNEGSFPKLRCPGREADHLPSTSAKVKKMWVYTATPL